MLVACLPQMGLVEELITHNLVLKKDKGIPRGVGASSAENGNWFVVLWEDHGGEVL